MGARARCFVEPFVVLLLAAASVRAQQDSGQIEQPPSESPFAGEPSIQVPCGPTVWFQADWLWTSHAGMWSDTRNFIDGPNATSFDNLSGFSGENGYRLQGGVRLGNWIFEGIYSHFGDWESSLNENVNGVAFNANGIAGNWAGQNFINTSTYFTPIFNAANLISPVNTAGDQSGLGPSTAFVTDPRPAVMAYSHTDFYMTEANVKGADYYFPLYGRGLRLGLGYVNANLNNDAWVALSGTFRASDVSGTTVSLPNSVLTAATGGNLTPNGGGGTGFTDGISNGGTGTPSQLLFTHVAKTWNEFNGAQLVLDGDLLEFNHLDFGATVKAGIFDNFAQGSIVETYKATNNDLSSYAREFTGSCHQLAFMGGVGIDTGWHITDEIAIRVGYDALFLSNLALGPEQINGVKNGWYHVQTDGSAVIQSVHTGL
ncbi:MAG: hypothetical protein ACLP9L_29950, partial [Thermoguttaceae bacterium]